MQIGRRADQIVVSAGGDEPLTCSGAEAASISNVDGITVRVARESLDSLIVDLHNGPLAPGATAESDGTEEIELSLEQAPGTVFVAIGTTSSDVVQLGSLGGGNYGVNLNGAAETVPDVDVTGRNALVGFGLGQGDDRVDPLGRVEFASRALNAPLFVLGGQGNDVLLGNDRRNVLDGGPGRDRLVGAALGDQLRGGSGADRIDGKDRTRDAIDCGRGDDVVLADPIDERRNCG